MDDKTKQKLNYLNRAHPSMIENMYADYRKDPDSVELSWRRFFEGYEFRMVGDSERTVETATAKVTDKEFKVLNLIDAYRRRGHLFTKTNPVRTRRHYSPSLDLSQFGLSESDLDTPFNAGSEVGLGKAALRDIVDLLKETYCRSIGAEYRFIRHPEKLKWLQERMETSRNRPGLSLDEKTYILNSLSETVLFEHFLHTKFVGQKRFAISGGESLIPGVQAIIDEGVEHGASDFVIGMPHRGRLNILANIMKKPYQQIFAEFGGKDYSSDYFIGDVKYHLGYTNRVNTRTQKKALVTLMPNPSHLEAVDPFTQGVARSRIDHKHGGDSKKVIPIVIHGDAAIAGQGVVYEVLQMSQLPGYQTGGTIHLVINNQLGFTTNYLDGRSSTYCTDVAKVTLSPVFHVNADDVEAVVFAVRLAVEYRQTFHTDVFIDLLGYRKYGHNESDEPRFTQPKLYKAIAKHPDPKQIYQQKLIDEKVVDKTAVKALEKSYKDRLKTDLERVQSDPDFKWESESDVEKELYSDRIDLQNVESTAVSIEKIEQLGQRIFSIPSEVNVIDKIRKLYQNRHLKLTKDKEFDWAMGEALALASILDDGKDIRFSGQDSQRGTFSHRHAVLLVEDTEESYVPLNQIRQGQGVLEIYNSPLSEYGVLGFEYGYASADKDDLTIWEAQFGDFSNGAQITIDEFISSAKAKWGKQNGIVLFLPHGYEGQGPDHSSARLERLLQLCAKDNMLIANCTTPANLFHVLRRHMRIVPKVPLVLLTHKSLLRLPACTSPVTEFCENDFRAVIEDRINDPNSIRRVLLCSGKIYYELEKYRAEKGINDVAIIRLEQLYPLPTEALNAAIERFPNRESLVWVQEEPENMGAWTYIAHKLRAYKMSHVARTENSAPASGFYAVHLREQKDLIESAFHSIKEGTVKGRAVRGICCEDVQA